MTGDFCGKCGEPLKYHTDKKGNEESYCPRCDTARDPGSIEAAVDRERREGPANGFPVHTKECDFRTLAMKREVDELKEKVKGLEDWQWDHPEQKHGQPAPVLSRDDVFIRQESVPNLAPACPVCFARDWDEGGDGMIKCGKCGRVYPAPAQGQTARDIYLECVRCGRRDTCGDRHPPWRKRLPKHCRGFAPAPAQGQPRCPVIVGMCIGNNCKLYPHHCVEPTREGAPPQLEQPREESEPIEKLPCPRCQTLMLPTPPNHHWGAYCPSCGYPWPSLRDVKPREGVGGV